MNVQFVEEIRVLKRLSHKELAEKLDVSLQMVRIWCGVTKVKRQPTGMDLETLCKLQILSGWSEQYFLRRIKAEFLPEE